LASLFFGFASSIALLFADEPNRYDPFVIACVHLFTIGFMLNALCGALLQMLPVVGGVKLDAKKRIIFSFFTLNLSVLLFFAGFAFFRPALAFALFGLALFLPAMFFTLLQAIYRTRPISPANKAVAVGIIAGTIAVLVGLHLLASHAFFGVKESHYALTGSHILVAVFGFFAAILISVAHIVLPMFFVTQSFPSFCKAWPFVLTGASLSSILPIDSRLPSFAIYLAMLAFSVVALKKLKERKRLLSDASLKLWQIGLFCAATGSVVGFLQIFGILEDAQALLAALFGIGFFGSVIIAMSLKIVPFLAWFHLTSNGIWDAPSVREFIRDKSANIVLALHAATIFFCTLYPLFEPALKAASITGASAFVLLFWLAANALYRFENILKQN